MSTHPLVERFRTGDVPAQARAAAARGALPLSTPDLLQVLFHLRGEQSLQADIVQTIGGLPVDALLELASDTSTSPAMLDFLARTTFRNAPLIERILLNPGTGDETFMLLGEHGPPSLLELMMLNQIRLARNPAIIQAILRNKQVTLSIRRRLKEIWELHQGEVKAREARALRLAQAQPVAEAETAAVPAPASDGGEPGAPSPDQPVEAGVDDEPSLEGEIEGPAAEADLGDLEDLADLGESTLDAAILEQLQAEGASEEELRLAERLITMSVAEKVQLALKGNRESRALLVRDASKLVQEAVVKSPKVTEDEIEKMASMRSLTADVLRLIASNREYTRNYTIALTLVKNPRTPLPSAMQLMGNLQERDLKFMVKDKNISEAIRRQSRLLLEKRKKK